MKNEIIYYKLFYFCKSLKKTVRYSMQSKRKQILPRANNVVIRKYYTAENSKQSTATTSNLLSLLCIQ